MNLENYKTKEQFNSINWSDYYVHKYQSVKINGVWYYKF